MTNNDSRTAPTQTPTLNIFSARADAHRAKLREKYELTINGSAYQAEKKTPYLMLEVPTIGTCPSGFQFSGEHSYCPFSGKKTTLLCILAEHMIDHVVAGEWDENQFAEWMESVKRSASAN